MIMNKSIMFKTLISIALIAGILSAAQSADNELVEIKLVDDIDEARGYCLDIAGGRGAHAPLDRGLQAHTCYDYTGGLLEDQSFDAALIKQGQFKLPYFNVCMTASAIQVGASIELASCKHGSNQKFILQANGHMISEVNPELCVTVSRTQKREGRGGKPVHVMRPLSLQLCKKSESAYQRWSTYSI